MTLPYFKTYYKFVTVLNIYIRVLRMSWKIYGELGGLLSVQDHPVQHSSEAILIYLVTII